MARPIREVDSLRICRLLLNHESGLVERTRLRWARGLGREWGRLGRQCRVRCHRHLPRHLLWVRRLREVLLRCRLLRLRLNSPLPGTLGG